MRVLVFGGMGMLGHKLVQVLGQKFEVWTTIRGEVSAVERYGIFDPDHTIGHFEATNPESVRLAVETVKPAFVINAIGIIKQSPISRDVIQTLALNSIFPHRLADLATEFGFRLITISTDCVFDGKKGNYVETDAPDAHDLYGLSKLLGEVTDDRSLTIRTSIIGRELTAGHSIVEWFLGKRGGSVKGYTNAIYTGFPCGELAGIISNLIADHPGLNGLYHISSEPISKFELLVLLNKYYKANVDIEASGEIVIDRSLDSSQFRSITGFKPAKWTEMIEQLAADTTPYEKLRIAE